MITPAYSPTATERVLPRMALDFTTASLDSRVTVTRALSTATRVNSSGLIETVSANLPRFDFNPVTKVCRGLLIEETRTNIALSSTEFDSANWTTSNLNTTGTPPWVNVAISPDGTQNAEKLIENTANALHVVYRPTSVSTATYTFSCFIKAAGRTQASLDFIGGSNFAIFDLTTGNVVTQSGTGLVANPSEDYGDGWFRVSITQAQSAGTIFISVAPASGGQRSYLGNGTDGVFVWGAQLEIGSFATSFIPTTTAIVQRNADDVSMTGTNFSSWFNATEGTFSSQFIINAKNSATQVNAILCSSALSGTNRITVFGGSSTYSSRVVETGNITSIDVGTVSANQVQSVALAYKQNSFAFSANAVTPGTSASGNIPAYVDRLVIGNLSYLGTTQGYQLNGCMQKIRYWPQRLINAEVQAFSK